MTQRISYAVTAHPAGAQLTEFMVTETPQGFRVHDCGGKDYGNFSTFPEARNHAAFNARSMALTLGNRSRLNSISYEKDYNAMKTYYAMTEKDELAAKPRNTGLPPRVKFAFTAHHDKDEAYYSLALTPFETEILFASFEDGMKAMSNYMTADNWKVAEYVPDNAGMKVGNTWTIETI